MKIVEFSKFADKTVNPVKVWVNCVCSTESSKVLIVTDPGPEKLELYGALTKASIMSLNFN